VREREKEREREHKRSQGDRYLDFHPCRIKGRGRKKVGTGKSKVPQWVQGSGFRVSGFGFRVSGERGKDHTSRSTRLFSNGGVL